MAVAVARRRVDPVGKWKVRQRLAFAVCWAAGLGLCAIAVGILGYMAYRGAQYLRPNLLTERPQPGLNQHDIGGFLDPMLGTLMLTVIGIALATPVAVLTALWVVEYG